MKPRVLGEIFPLSVSTAIPFELLVEYEEIDKYNAIYINLATLIRNASGCIEDKVKTPQDVVEAVLDDIMSMYRIRSENYPHLGIVIYYNTNRRLLRRFKFSQLILPHTEKQIAYRKLTDKTIALLRDKLEGDLVEFNTDITPVEKLDKILIITHQCTDLLSARRFKLMSLLESHTGAIKGRLQWNTKLTNGNKLLNMPFCKLTVGVFGDNNQLIRPMDKEFRNAIKYIAERGKWTANSTEILMRHSIKTYADVHSKRQLLKLF